MNFEVSRLNQDELNLNELKHLYHACEWDWPTSDDEMYEALRGSFQIYAATVGTNIIGFARLISDGKVYGLLVDCMVHPEFRRNGVGKCLMDFILSQSCGAGLKVIQLLASRDGSTLYQKVGFTKCPEESPGMVKFLK